MAGITSAIRFVQGSAAVEGDDNGVGSTQSPTAGSLGGHHGVAEVTRTSVLSSTESIAGRGRVRLVAGEPLPSALRRGARSSLDSAGCVLSHGAHRLLRR